MSPASMRIGDLIDVPPVKTVIRLDEGRDNPAEIAGSFVFTREVSAHLRVISGVRVTFCRGISGPVSPICWRRSTPGFRAGREQNSSPRGIRN